MGNLGLYQTMTTVAKTLGGPAKALALVGTGVAVVGYGVIRGAEAAGKRIYRKVAANRSAPSPVENRQFTVTGTADAGGGLTLRAGDDFRVLGCDGDVILIEVVGNPDNPYFVSGALLSSISNFSAPDRDRGESM